MNTSPVILPPLITKYLDRLKPAAQDRVLTTDMWPGHMTRSMAGVGPCLVGVADPKPYHSAKEWDAAHTYDHLCYAHGNDAVQVAIRGYILAKREPRQQPRDPFTNHPVFGPRYRRRRALVSTLVMLLCCLVIA